MIHECENEFLGIKKIKTDSKLAHTLIKSY